VSGDAVEALPVTLDSIAEDVVPIVFHTHVANQLPPDRRQALLTEIDRQGSQRDLAHVYNCIEPHTHAAIFIGSQRLDIPLANAHDHGHWVEWLD